MSDRIHQELVYEADPKRIYGILTDAEAFSAMSGGAPAEIDRREGGAFSCFGGMIEGRNVECVPGERLVQALASQDLGARRLLGRSLRATAREHGDAVGAGPHGLPGGPSRPPGQGLARQLLGATKEDVGFGRRLARPGPPRSCCPISHLAVRLEERGGFPPIAHGVDRVVGLRIPPRRRLRIPYVEHSLAAPHVP